VRTLTQPELNRALLARQMLLERVDAPIPAVLERMGGLQAQYAPSIYLGLWSRVRGLERAAVTRALEQRAIVQGTLLRRTIHAVSRADYWPFARAPREERRAGALRDPTREVTGREMAGAARRLRSALGGSTLRRTEIEELVGKRRADVVGLWEDLVRVPPSGTWERRRADVYALAEDWLGEPPAIEKAEAVGHLVRRYLAAFGPAHRTDVATWAGLPVTVVQRALDGMDLRRFADEQDRELLDVPGAPLPPGNTPAPVRFLPTYDATLLVHARRTLILPEEHRPRVFHTRLPQSVPTFLVDGAVAGSWRFADGRVELEPFEPLDDDTRRLVDDEADRLAAFHA
jgi:hypothetical protein